MQSTTAKLALALGAVAVIVVAFVVLQDNDHKKSSSSQPTQTSGGGTTKPPTTTIVLKDGKPVGGFAKLSYNKGDQVTFVVKPDVDGDVHIHGYNLEEPGTAGKPLRFSFAANIEGVFEIEDHGSNEKIAQLTVNP